MRIVSSKRINFLVSNIFERYYEPILEELYCSGLAEELVKKVVQEILMAIYRKAMEQGVEKEEELDFLAEGIINEHLERVLISYYARKYVDRFPLDKATLGKEKQNNAKENIQDECEENAKKPTVMEFDEKPEKEIYEKPITESCEKSLQESGEKPITESYEKSLQESCEKPLTESYVTSTNEVSETSKEQVIEEPSILKMAENELEKGNQKISEKEIVEPEKKILPYGDYEDTEEVEIIDLVCEGKDVPIVRRMEEPRIRRFRINWGLTVLVSVIVTLILWFAIGMLMGRGYIPRMDFGYTWFNSHIGRVF